MDKADYREISQQYAQGAIKAIIFINSGATVAVLSQMQNISALIPLWSIGTSLILFVFGVAVGSLCWLAAFFSTRYVDRALRGEDQDYSRANRWMYVGISFVVIGILLFLFGSLILAIMLIFCV